MRMRNAMQKRCDAMGLAKSANANENAKNFSHYHPRSTDHFEVTV